MITSFSAFSISRFLVHIALPCFHNVQWKMAMMITMIKQHMNELRTLSFGNAILQYTLKVSTLSRRVRVTVYRDGRCQVTVPHTMDRSAVERFVHEKAHWILKKKEFFNQRQGVQVLKSDPETYKKYRQQAFELVNQKIEKFNAIYRFSFARICIRNQKSRWGSCSRRRNLNFNVKIALIPETLVEYIVVHELCHLKELNHSRAFWSLVSHTIPNYALRRRELKQFCIV